METIRWWIYASLTWSHMNYLIVYKMKGITLLWWQFEITLLTTGLCLHSTRTQLSYHSLSVAPRGKSWIHLQEFLAILTTRWSVSTPGVSSKLSPFPRFFWVWDSLLVYWILLFFWVYLRKMHSNGACLWYRTLMMPFKWHSIRQTSLLGQTFVLPSDLIKNSMACATIICQKFPFLIGFSMKIALQWG